MALLHWDWLNLAVSIPAGEVSIGMEQMIGLGIVIVGALVASLGAVSARSHVRLARRAYQRSASVAASMPDGWQAWFLLTSDHFNPSNFNRLGSQLKLYFGLSESHENHHLYVSVLQPLYGSPLCG